MMCPLCRSELAIVPGQVLALNKVIQSIRAYAIGSCFLCLLAV